VTELRVSELSIVFAPSACHRFLIAASGSGKRTAWHTGSWNNEKIHISPFNRMLLFFKEYKQAMEYTSTELSIEVLVAVTCTYSNKEKLQGHFENPNTTLQKGFYQLSLE
jgi:hypothetical protein